MNQSLITKLEKLAERQQELHGLLADPAVIRDNRRFRELSKEAAEVGPVVQCYGEYRGRLQSMAHARDMLQDVDAGVRELAEVELKDALHAVARIEGELKRLLLPQDPADSRNIFLEIRAGTGGEEAALFAADLLRMYTRYADSRGWKTEIVSSAVSDLRGFREVVVRIAGSGAFSRLKFESGVHRVQRVPQTEAQGRIHTSACTVAVLPEPEEIDEIDLNPVDLRIDTFRASGAGGQHVNKTDSAIRVTHLPSGIVVECQDERSQHKNRAKAMAVLRARLLAAERGKQAAERAETRRNLVGSGDRSERIRTYNFPQGRVTDHRINVTLYSLDRFLDGDLDPVVEPLISEYQADQLAALGGEL
ncbi:MAG: peptide chain release factor 1 [Gammaproteobacteria bacterium]|nr:peptide chain release factor 1 [Gammaproteobacteria bacterium]